MYEMQFLVLGASHLRVGKDAWHLTAIAVVAAGYGRDMDEKSCNELLDDMDCHFNNVKCLKIEGLMPRLMKVVESEVKVMGYGEGEYEFFV